MRNRLLSVIRKRGAVPSRIGAIFCAPRLSASIAMIFPPTDTTRTSFLSFKNANEFIGERVGITATGVSQTFFSHHSGRGASLRSSQYMIFCSTHIRVVPSLDVSGFTLLG